MRRKEKSSPFRGQIASRLNLADYNDMSTRRTVRVAEVLRKELSACMIHALDLEGMLITISSVELPPDMRQAYIYVSTLNPKVEQGSALTILNRNRKEWQSSIGRRLGLKFTPQLIFRFDDSIERGDRVMEILTKLHLEDEAPEKKSKS
jgi:ribosome-binding factor A